jgi:cysteinyl-tRNA synthetase
LFELAKGINREANQLIHQGTIDADATELFKTWNTLKQLAAVLGLETDERAEASALSLAPEAIEALIAERSSAKAAKDFAKADRIRNDLKDQGIVLVDQPGGKTLWHSET